MVNDLEYVRVNKFAQVLHTTAKDNNILKVDRSSIFAARKEVYIIQMQGTNAGQSMFTKVKTVDYKNSIVTISTGLTFSCSSTGNNRCQVATVPNYLKVTMKGRATITAVPWNGQTGGIIVFRSKLQVCLSYSIYTFVVCNTCTQSNCLRAGRCGTKDKSNFSKWNWIPWRRIRNTYEIKRFSRYKA